MHPQNSGQNPPFLYVPYYCEENVFHLCLDPRFADRRRQVAFISNRARTCVMWHQRAARKAGAHLFWDYHVVLLARSPWEIWDLDTTLGLPVPAADYLARSFRADLLDQFMPRFRLIDAALFAATFASDRSHMRRPGGAYRKPPPPWPLIGPPGAEPNLMRFVDMDQPFVGEVLDLPTLSARVASAPSS